MKTFEQLTNDEINSFMTRYYDGEAVRQLLAEFNVKANHTNIYEHFPAEELSDTCEFCKTKLVMKRLSRRQQSNERKKEDAYCPKCNHRPFNSHCECDNCQNSPERKQEKLHADIIDYCNSLKKSVEYDKLNFTNKVYLAALLISRGQEQLNNKILTKPEHENLAPSIEMEYEILNSLINAKAICIDPESPQEAFCIENGEFQKRYYPCCAFYRVTVQYKYAERYFFDEVLCPVFDERKLANEALTIWQKIAVSECMEYLEYQLNLFGINCEIGDRTQSLFRSLINVYSVSQVYWIIWSSVSVAIRNKLLHKQKDAELGKSVVSRCFAYRNLPENERNKIGNFNRISELPQSIISSFYFNQVLEIGDKGFHHVPNTNDIVMGKFCR